MARFPVRSKNSLCFARLTQPVHARPRSACTGAFAPHQGGDQQTPPKNKLRLALEARTRLRCERNLRDCSRPRERGERLVSRTPRGKFHRLLAWTEGVASRVNRNLGRLLWQPVAALSLGFVLFFIPCRVVCTAIQEARPICLLCGRHFPGMIDL